MLEATNACANTDLHENDHEVSKVFVDLCHIQHSSCVPIVINESALCYSKDASHNKQQAKNKGRNGEARYSDDHDHAIRK